jgi:hypothetical protein
VRGKRALAALGAGLALAVSACGDQHGGGASPQLRPAVDPADQLEFGENAVRIGGISGADVAAGAALAVYPPHGEEPPSSWFFVRADRWTDAVLAAQFATRPIDGGLLVTNKEYLPTATVDVLNRVRVDGFPKGKGLKAIGMSKVGPDVLIGLKDRKLVTTLMQEKTPFEQAKKLVPFHGGGAGRYSPTIVVASGDQRDYALPAAAWAAYSGDALVLVTRDKLPAATRAIVAQREKVTLERPHIYVIGPESVISDAVARELATYGDVKRVGRGSAIETAVELARYRDPETQFGWGFKRGPANVSLVNAGDWRNAVGAFTFAATGPQAPLLLTDSSEQLPAPVLDYVRSLRTTGTGQGFVFGDRNSVGSAAFAQLDEALGER